MLKAMVAEVGIVKPFYFEWPQELGGAGTTGGVAKKGNKGDNTITLASNTPPPSVGRYITFKPRDGKLYSVTHAPVGDQTADYEIGVLPNLVETVPSTAIMRAEKPVTKAMFTVKPQFPTTRSIILTGTCVVSEVLP